MVLALGEAAGRQAKARRNLLAAGLLCAGHPAGQGGAAAAGGGALQRQGHVCQVRCARCRPPHTCLLGVLASAAKLHQPVHRAVPLFSFHPLRPHALCCPPLDCSMHAKAESKVKGKGTRAMVHSGPLRPFVIEIKFDGEEEGIFLSTAPHSACVSVMLVGECQEPSG